MVESCDAKPKCPACGSPLEYRDIYIARPFQCGTCKECLSVSQSYRSWFRWVGIILAFPLCWFLGFRNLSLLVLIPVACFLLGAIGSIIIKRIAPPEIQRGDTGKTPPLFPTR